MSPKKDHPSMQSQRRLCGKSFRMSEKVTGICQRTPNHEGDCGPAPLIEVLVDE